MSHYYGTLEGQAGKATRRGSKNSGLCVTAASWQGAISIELTNRNGQDHALIYQGPWQGATPNRVVLYDGPFPIKMAKQS